MALGGVATGIIKAQLTVNVIGIKSCKGGYPRLRATEPRIGRNTAVVAVLLVSSVRKLTKLTILSRTNQAGK